MNDSDRGGMTISSSLMVGLIVSLAIPEIAILFLSIMKGADQTIFTSTVVGAVLVVLVGVLSVNYFVRRAVQDRLSGLIDVCRTYSGGDRSARAPVTGDDEFAMLSVSLNSLLDGQGTATPGSSSVGSGDAAALQAQIEKLLQEVSAVGDGDLRVQAEVTPDTLGVLADSFNYMIEELAKVVGRVQATALQVTNATRRILERTNELTHASQAQVAQISQTTQQVEALAIFIRNVAHNAQLSAEVALEAIRSADAGQQAVRQSIEGMGFIRENVQETSKKIKRLGERSNEIGEIVRIIEDIADQTNLLALNAAIQSAMAGEHGRGFAVVADEIRLLAERSTESTKRIATLVKSIQGDTYEAVVAMEDSTQEVVKGSQLADEAGRAFNAIYSAVERQAQMIQGIAQAANEQAQVSESVAVAMSDISQITEQTNMGTQEASMSVSYLAELADQLRASVATFRLPERANEMVDVFPSMSDMPALPTGEGEQYYQDMSMPGEWNQGFSSDYLPLPQPQEASNSGAYQFAFSNQQDFSGQDNFGNGQQFPSPQFHSQPDFGQFNQGNFNGGNFNQGNFGSFDHQQNFEGQPEFEFAPEAAFGNQGQQFFPPSGQPPRVAQQNFGSQPGQPMGPRPRLRNPQQNQSSFNQDQMPFPNNGHLGQ